jgi:hypothetical protein
MNSCLLDKLSGEIEVKFKTINTETLIKNTSIFDLDNKIVPYLSPSRLCPSDKLMKLAFKLLVFTIGY